MSDFRDNHYKGDKICGGVVHVVLMLLLLASTLVSSVTSWWNDANPYMASVIMPFSTEGLYERDSKVYFK